MQQQITWMAVIFIPFVQANISAKVWEKIKSVEYYLHFTWLVWVEKKLQSCETIIFWRWEYNWFFQIRHVFTLHCIWSRFLRWWHCFCAKPTGTSTTLLIHGTIDMELLCLPASISVFYNIDTTYLYITRGMKFIFQWSVMVDLPYRYSLICALCSLSCTMPY